VGMQAVESKPTGVRDPVAPQLILYVVDSPSVLIVSRLRCYRGSTLHPPHLLVWSNNLLGFSTGRSLHKHITALDTRLLNNASCGARLALLNSASHPRDRGKDAFERG